MKNLCMSIFCSFVFLFSPLVAKPIASQHEMFDTLDFIKRTFQIGYAQTEWKSEFCGWNLDDEIDIAKNQINKNPNLSNKEFHQLTKNFFNATKDYHSKVQFYSTESACLPFRVRGAEGRYFITYIDRWWLNNAGYDFPFVEGDEITLFDDLPIFRAIREFKIRELGNRSDLTNSALAEMYLTKRSGSLGHFVPQGAIRISGYNKGSGKLISYTTQWDYLPELILPLPAKMMLAGRSPNSVKKLDYKIKNNPIFKKQCVLPDYKNIKALNKSHKLDHNETDILGSRRSFIPFLGPVVWEADEESIFHAYLFQTDDGKIGGYLRIPSYMPDDVEEAVDEFSGLIALFEEAADVLVIDQLNNPGGLMLYMYSLLDMLSEKPMEVPSHRMMLEYDDIQLAVSFIPLLEMIENDEEAQMILGDLMVGMPTSYELAQSVKSYFEFIVEHWNLGDRFTPPSYLYGIKTIGQSEGVHYTKPILVLVNSLDFSCGDFFPAILQDNKRATILGTKTAGAGGYVLETSFLNLQGIAHFSYTGSIAFRLDGQPIENYGVTPDIVYNMTTYDLQNNYGQYIRTIQEALK